MRISRYVLNQKHRAAQPSANASVWRIPDWEEISLCVEAAKKQWTCAKGSIWNASASVTLATARLGEDTQGDLWVGKFISDHNDEWHGYPVRPIKTDIPPAVAIRAWVALGRITLANARRMQKGQL